MPQYTPVSPNFIYYSELSLDEPRRPRHRVVQPQQGCAWEQAKLCYNSVPNLYVSPFSWTHSLGTGRNYKWTLFLWSCLLSQHRHLHLIKQHKLVSVSHFLFSNNPGIVNIWDMCWQRGIQSWLRESVLLFTLQTQHPEPLSLSRFLSLSSDSQSWKCLVLPSQHHTTSFLAVLEKANIKPVT